MAHLVSRLVGEVRLECDNPEVSRPTDDLILLKAADVSQQMMNLAANSPFAWNVSSWDLPAQPGVAEYKVPDAQRFGKVEWIHTILPGDPYHVNRPIPVVERQHRPEVWRGPETAQSGVYYNSEHSAVGVIPYYRGTEPYLELIPTPQAAVQYRVWFEVGELPELALSSQVPVMRSFHRYVRLKTSWLILPYCAWGGMDAQDTRARREELRASLTPFLQQWERDWQVFVATSHQAGSIGPQGFVSEEYLGGW